MSVARTGLPHTHRTPIAQDRRGDRDPTATAVTRPQLPAPDHAATGSMAAARPHDSRTRVRELVARQRITGIRPHARRRGRGRVSERRAYELLRAVRAEDPQP